MKSVNFKRPTIRLKRRYMKNKWIINSLTLIRIPISIILCSVLLHDKYSIRKIILMFTIIAFSDYFDGKLARKYNLETSYGAKLDVMCDFFFMITSYSTLIFLKVFSLWSIFLITSKFIEFLITSYVISIQSQATAVFSFDKLGKLAAVIFYILPIIGVIVHRIFPTNYSDILNLTLSIVAILSITSTAIRITKAVDVKNLRKVKQAKSFNKKHINSR